MTYIAADFLFIGGALIVGAFLVMENHEEAKDVFLTILPISAAVVTYWFAIARTAKALPTQPMRNRKVTP